MDVIERGGYDKVDFIVYWADELIDDWQILTSSTGF